MPLLGSPQPSSLEIIPNSLIKKRWNVVPLLLLVISIHTRACFFTGVPPRTRNFLARARVRASGLARLIELIMPKFFLDGKLVLACALTDPVWKDTIVLKF